MVLKYVTLVGGILGLLGCEAAPSDTVHEFLAATRDGDLATLATVSTVGWPGDRVAASDIEAWWISRVTESAESPFDFEEWQRRLTNARESRDARLQEAGEGDDPELQRIQSRVDRLRDRVEREREEARKSVETWALIDGLRGDVEIRRVEAVVRSPAGDYHYALTLKRYRLSDLPDESAIPSRWIVTAIEAVES